MYSTTNSWICLYSRKQEPDEDMFHEKV